jgi:GNAT superfamily N-acetyltransferase
MWWHLSLGECAIRTRCVRMPPYRRPMAGSPLDTSTLTTAALTPATWEAFAALVERHNGVWGGCWCTWFHTLSAEKEHTVEANRALKERLVEEGRAHAALVLDGDEAIGWCQFGSPEELPNINHRREVDGSGDPRPDYRVTCFFVDRRYRRQGVAEVALRGVLELVALAGGGVVEAYPQDTAGRKVTSSFLYSATRSLFEDNGFDFVRVKGKNHTVMRRVVPAA